MGLELRHARARDSRTTREQIPGFTYEALTIGITVGLLLLWWMREHVK